jgi:hypothetical protein
MFRVIFFLVCFFTLNAIVEVIAANGDRRAFIRARSGTVVGDLDRHTHRSATEILYNRRFLCNRLCVCHDRKNDGPCEMSSLDGSRWLRHGCFDRGDLVCVRAIDHGPDQ